MKKDSLDIGIIHEVLQLLFNISVVNVDGDGAKLVCPKHNLQPFNAIKSINPYVAALRYIKFF